MPPHTKLQNPNDIPHPYANSRKSKNMIDHKELSTFDELIEKEHGPIGSDSLVEYEARAQMFIVSEMLKAARKEAKLTQEEQAIKGRTRKSYISKIDNGKGKMQLSTLIRLLEKGLNRKIGFSLL